MSSFFFDGSSKSRAINLGGNRDGADKKETLERTRRERAERAEQQRRKEASVKIQAAFRGRREMSRRRSERRAEFDAFIRGSAAASTMPSLTELLSGFLFFYRPNGGPDREDWLRLDRVCQMLMRSFRSQDPAVNYLGGALREDTRARWVVHMKRFLRYIVYRLQSQTGTSEQLTWPMQILLMLTDPTKWTIRSAPSFGPAEEETIRNVCGLLHEHIVKVGLFEVARGYVLFYAKLLPGANTPPEKNDLLVTVVCATSMRVFKDPLTNPEAAFLHLFRQLFTVPLLRLRLNPALYEAFVDPVVFAGGMEALVNAPSFNLPPPIAGEEGGVSQPSSVWLLANVLRLGRSLLATSSTATMINYVKVLRLLMDDISPSLFRKETGVAAADDDEEEGVAAMPDVPPPPALTHELDILVSPDHTRTLFRGLSLDPASLRGRAIALPATLSPLKPSPRARTGTSPPTPMAIATVASPEARESEGVLHLCALGTLLMQRWPSARVNLLNTFVYSTPLVPSLWALLKSSGQLERYAAEGASDDSEWLVSILTFFCECCDHLLFTLDDDEFFDESRASFNTDEFVDLAHFLKRMVFRMHWVGSGGFHGFATSLKKSTEVHLLNMATKLLNQLHRRDARSRFCPAGFWEARQIIPHTFAEEFIASEDRENSRCKAVLDKIPFVVPFDDRVRIWQHFIATDKRNQVHRDDFGMMEERTISVRRTHLFEDGFEKLNNLRQGLKSRIRVSFIDQFGQHEAGIDGGGLFKEFLTELAKTCYGPGYGLFKETPERTLYPNPDSSVYHADGADRQHFEFLGRLLGKALYENILVELPFAEFFLWKLLGQQNYLNDLPSLDPELHENLLKLKKYDGNVADLGLYFTVAVNDMGHEVELIENGSNIPVTNENRVQYIYYVANYRLNTQIRQQSSWFMNGLSDIIDPFLLRMFDQHELQVLISGSVAPVDVNDWRRHTQYGGGLGEGNFTVDAFWDAVESFTPEQRSKLLKFATSCSRPPLLGFGELYPPFTIHSAGTDHARLPTASTCMNLLKLPLYTDRNVLREKLLLAMEANTGFSLS